MSTVDGDKLLTYINTSIHGYVLNTNTIVPIDNLDPSSKVDSQSKFWIKLGLVFVGLRSVGLEIRTFQQQIYFMQLSPQVFSRNNSMCQPCHKSRAPCLGLQTSPPCTQSVLEAAHLLKFFQLAFS